MRTKRVLSLLLTCAVLCGMLVLPTAADTASTVSTAFTDIADPEVAGAAETLRLLGIVNGTGGTAFTPERTLTRAEFCKMAVELMGNGDQVPAQMNRTIFKDVPATHWARGYIAVATQSTTSGSGENASTTPGIIRGDAYGNFNPDRAITYAEAVTILVRILGYGDSDVGMVWPSGYLAKADELALSDGVRLAAGDTITRGQTALLMENLLFIDTKGSDKEYLTNLACTITDETIVFDVAAIAPDGGAGVKVSEDKVYKTDHTPFSDDLVGRRAKLMLDKDEKIVAVQPSENGTQQVVGILSMAYDSMKVSGGGTVDIDEPEKTEVWQDGKATTYDKVYLSGLAAGTQAVLQYSAAGELEYIFVRTAAGRTDNSTTVVKNKPNYSGNESYAVYKNGIPATTEDIRQYDVTTFDAANNVMYVSDLRITGIYENVYPNRDTPATITVMGHDFTVLPGAASDLRSFEPGDKLTLLLAYNGMVAGAVETSAAKSTTVGTVESIDSSGNATITTLNLLDENGKPLTLTGGTAYTGTRADDMLGQLVSVSSTQKGRLSLTKLTGGGSKSALDVQKRTMGSVKLSDNVKLYEQVNASPLVEIELEDITRATVPTGQITYVHTDYAGNADIVVLNDATGDCYTYGMLKVETTRKPIYGDLENPDTVTGWSTTTHVGIENAENPSPAADLLTYTNYRDGKPYGVVEGPKRKDGTRTLGTAVELKSVDNVRSDAFDMDEMTLTLPSMVLPIADNVQCYNKATETWFAVGEKASDEDYKNALNLARAYSGTLTVYYDKSPDEGGKVRLVVVG